MPKKIQIIQDWKHFEKIAKHFSSHSRVFWESNGTLKCLLESEISWAFETKKNKRKIGSKLKDLGFIETERKDFIEF